MEELQEILTTIFNIIKFIATNQPLLFVPIVLIVVVIYWLLAPRASSVQIDADSSLPREETCSYCGGRGTVGAYQKWGGYSRCSHCNGHGWVWMHRH